MAEGFRGFRPYLALDGGVNDGLRTGAAASASSASAVNASTAVNAGAALAQSFASGAVPLSQTDAFVTYRFYIAVQGMGAFVGASSSGATVTGALAQTIVRTGAAFAGATATARNAAAGGEAAWRGLRTWFSLEGSTPAAPWGAASSGAFVTGAGVYSVAGDYATPPRSVFEIPPPADFKPPGVTLDYGLPTSLRAAVAVLGEIAGYSSASADRRLAWSFTAASSAAAGVSGQQRAVVIFAAAATGGARVTGVAVGVSSIVESGAAAAGADVAGQDRSLSPGAALGTATAGSNAEAVGAAAFAQAGAAASGSSAYAVDVSGYPLAAPAAVSSSGADVAGEAVAEVVRTAAISAFSDLAAAQSVLAIAIASATSMATVRGVNAALGSILLGRGRRRVGSSNVSTAKPRVGSVLLGGGKSRIGSTDP
jgi:hypothetical protein